MKIAASVPLWNEDVATMRRCYDALAGVDEIIAYEAPVANYLAELGKPVPEHAFPDSRTMRQWGLDEAERRGCQWCLQIDCDEVLVNGHLLRPLLESGRISIAYPLPRIEEDGGWSVMPFKCVELPATLAASCDHFVIAGETWRLSGYPAPEEHLRPALLELPYLLHEPSRRQPARPVRLGAVEHLERIADAPVLPVPSLILPKEPLHVT